MPKGLLTDKNFIVSNKREFEAGKQQLVAYINYFVKKENTAGVPPVHPFSGNMSSHDWAVVAYKDLDRHWKQFGV